MRASALLAALWLAAVPLTAAAAKSDLPGWVLQAAQIQLPVYPADTPAVVLLDEQVITVLPDGTAVTLQRKVVKILRPQGRSYADISVWSDVDEKLNYVHAWSIASDGRQYTAKDNEFVDTSADEGGMLYVALRAKVLRPPAADPGAVIAYEYEQKQRPYVSEDDWYFQEDIPVYRATFELDLPREWKYYSAWLRHAPVAPTEVVPGHYRWEVNEIPAIDTKDVRFAPAVVALTARMTAHYAQSDLPDPQQRWAAIGEWYEKLASERAAQTPEIAAKAQELIAGETNFTQKLQSIARYLQQNIRYVGIEIGIGGWQPHPASEVLRNGYGDCKDKATLLKAMLDSAGVKTTWVMVDTRRGGVDPNLPSIYGNHMITAIEIPAGYKDPLLKALVTDHTGKQYLIFDPTDQHTPVGEIRPQLQASYGVLVDGKQSELIQLPRLAPSTNLLDRKARFVLSPDGALNGTVTESRTGNEAWGPRELFAESNAKDQREVMERRLREDFSAFTVESITAENAAQLDKDFVLRYTITAPVYGRLAGNLMLVRPRVLGSMALGGLDDKPRIYPIDLRIMRTERVSVDVELPRGYAVDETPDPVAIDTEFATYRSKIQIEGNILHYSRELVVSRLDLAPAQYTELRQFMGKIGADEQSVVVLKKQ